MTQQPMPRQPPPGPQAHPGQPRTPAGPVPSSVALARTLSFVLLGWVVLRTVLTIVLQGTILDSYAAARVEARGDDAFYDYYRNEASPAFTGQTIVAVVLALPVVVAALFYAKRARWAQVLATVFAVLVLVIGLLAFASSSPLWWQLLGLVASLLALAVVVTLFLGPSRAWFGKRS